MDSTPTILFFFSLLLVAALIYPCCRRWHIPYPLVLVMLGYLGGECVTRILHIDTGIKWHNFYPLIYFGLIPALIFYQALRMDSHSLQCDLFPVLLLAVPLMIIAAVLVAILLYYGIGHDSGFPWLVALIAGVLLSATDPSAVTHVLRSCGVPDSLLVILEGESLFNDATSIVLFNFFVGLALAAPGEVGVWLVFGHLLLSLVGGAVIGILGYWGLSLLLSWVAERNGQILLTVTWVYISFWVTEHYLYCSGIIATLTMGLLLARNWAQSAAEENTDHRAGTDSSSSDESSHKPVFSRYRPVTVVWNFFAHVCEMMIFLLAGITITITMFLDRWLAMLLAIIAVLLARATIIFTLFGTLRYFPGQPNLSFGQQTVLMWGGVRGTVTVALALSLPVVLPAWFTVQSMAYGVVLFALSVQTISLPWLCRRLQNSR